VFVEASRTENIKVAVLAIRTTITMNAGYGMGFLRNYIEVYIKGNSRGIKL